MEAEIPRIVANMVIFVSILCCHDGYVVYKVA
jgi:hypothetical protein